MDVFRKPVPLSPGPLSPNRPSPLEGGHLLDSPVHLLDCGPPLVGPLDPWTGPGYGTTAGWWFAILIENFGIFVYSLITKHVLVKDFSD